VEGGEDARLNSPRRKSGKGGARGSAHRGGVRDGGGGRTAAVARSDSDTVLRQQRGRLRTQETARSGRAHAKRGEARRRRGSDNGEALSERRCRSVPLWHGVGAWQPRGDSATTGGPGTANGG
jgi:hypothetical protein